MMLSSEHLPDIVHTSLCPVKKEKLLTGYLEAQLAHAAHVRDVSSRFVASDALCDLSRGLAADLDGEWATCKSEITQVTRSISTMQLFHFLTHPPLKAAQRVTSQLDQS